MKSISPKEHKDINLYQDYSIVCDPGEERHLKDLSNKIDFKVRELTKRFGKIGETRLMVMASLLIADEVHELNKKIDGDLKKINALEESLESKEKTISASKTKENEYSKIFNRVNFFPFITGSIGTEAFS